jgi:hypothetical protein
MYMYLPTVEKRNECTRKMEQALIVELVAPFLSFVHDRIK